MGFAGRDKRYFALNSALDGNFFDVNLPMPSFLRCLLFSRNPVPSLALWCDETHRVFVYFARLISNIIASTIKIEHCILSANSCIRQKPRRLGSLLVQNVEAILTQPKIRVKVFSPGLDLATGFYQNNIEVHNLKRLLSLVQSTAHFGIIQYKFYNDINILTLTSLGG